MRIKEIKTLIRKSGVTTQKVCAEIFFETDEKSDLENFMKFAEYAEGSIAYCYKGSDKGKVLVYDGAELVEQE